MRFKSFLRYFTRDLRRRKPISRKPSTVLAVEMLERRDLLTVPTIIATGVLPLDGTTASTSTPAMRVQFSETMTNSAIVASNYVLLNSAGSTIPINSVAFNNASIGGAPADSVVDITYNAGNPLLVDNYTLFARGDKLIDADEGLAMTQPGQLVVANAGRNSVTVLNMPGDGTIGGAANYFVPGQPGPIGLAGRPTGVVLGDLNGDGLNDLVVSNLGTNEITVYLGRPGGGYQTVPDLVLSPPGLVLGNDAVVLADLNKDGQLDIVSAFGGPVAGIVVYLNTSTPGNFSVNAGNTFATDNAASQAGGVTAGDYDGDGNIDIAVAITNAATDLTGDGKNDFRMDFFLGDGLGSLGAAVPVRVGDVVPTGMQNPGHATTGNFNLDVKPDIAVGSGTANGILLMQNNSTPGNLSFFNTPTLLPSAFTASLQATAPNAAGTQDLIAATTTGVVKVFRNNSTAVANGGSFLPSVDITITGGLNASSGLAVADLNGDGKPDFAVTNGDLTLGSGKLHVLQNTTVGAAISAATNPGLIVVTSKGHGLVTGQTVTISGAQGNTAANNNWTITQVTGAIVSADGFGGGDVSVNSVGHGLVTGESITIAGNSVASFNGVFTVTVVDADNFTLNGTSTVVGSGTAGTWTSNDRFSLNGSTANGNYIGGAYWARTGTIASVNGPGGAAPVTVVSPNSGLATGQAVTITGSAIPSLNGNTYTITTLSLSGTETSVGLVGQPIAITTSANHNLVTGDVVVISGDSFAAANGTFTITVTGTNTFTLGGTTGIVGTGTGGIWKCTTHGFTLNGTAGTVGAGAAGTWTTAVNFVPVAGSPYTTDSTPQGVAIGETNGTPSSSATANQYASSVFAFSSQYTTSSWAASQALGAPDVFAIGDNPSAWSELNPDGPPSPEFLDLRYSNPVNATGVVVRESYNPGFVSRIDLVDTSNVYHTVFNGADPSPPGGIANFTVNFPATPYLVKGVKVYVNPSSTIGDWEEIDSVELLAPASSGGTSTNTGTPDIVTANNNGNDFTVFLGKGDGTLLTGVTTSITPTVTNDVTLADLNGDGIVDMVLINNNNSSNNTQVTVMQGLGGGTYGNPINYSVGAGLRDLRSVAVGDITGDGMPDIAFVDGQDNNIGFLVSSLATNDPIAANSFAPSAGAAPAGVGRSPTQIVLVDLNSDGLLDMVVAHNGGGGGPNRRGVTVRLGNGNGSFQPAVEYDDNHGMTGVVVADFNRDGHLDFAALESPGGFGSANVWLNTGDGLGGFSNGQSFNTPLTSPGPIDAADFNGDGFPDVVAASTSSSFASGGLAILLNQLGGGFGTAVQNNTISGQGITSLVPSDVNRDGLADLVVAAKAVSKGISGATNVAGIVITSNNHGLRTGQQIYISGVGGNTAANGTWTVTVTSNNQFSIVATGNGNYTGGGSWSLLSDNVFILSGLGDGTFANPVPYLGGGQGGPPNAPSYLAATSSGLLRVTTFTSGGQTIETNLISNGDFESRDLTGEQGNLLGWRTFDLNASPGGSQGKWLPQTGFSSPLSSTLVNPPNGLFDAMLDEQNQIPYDPNFSFGPNPNPKDSFAGSHALYQDVTIPANATSARLSLSLSIDNTYAGVFNDPNANASLDFRTSANNQKVRVDIVRPTASILSVSTTPYLSGSIATAVGAGGAIVITTAAPSGLTTGNLVVISGVTGFGAPNGTFTVTVIDATHFSLNGTKAVGNGTSGTWAVPGDVLRNEFLTTLTTSATFNGVVQDLDLSAFAGQTIRIRIGAANNQGLLIVGVDDATLITQFDDSVAPTLTGLNVSNPAFVSAGIPHTNDPTLVGTVGDNSGLAGISYIEVNPNNLGFGLPGNAKIISWDAQGNFRFTIPNPPAGLNTVGMRVVDRAGNATTTTFKFFMQSNSVTEWEAVGPQGIDVTGQGVDYTTVSGRITVTVPDVSDSLGNSYFVGSANGGVWKTTDGGSHWVSLTNSVTDKLGNPVPVPIGGLAQSITNPNILYAATGVGDDELDSRPGIGVLKSIDGGKTWSVVGDSGTVLLGARAVKVVVDANNPNIAYVAVAAGGNSGVLGGPGGPGVYKTTDGGLTWNNVLDPARMTYLTSPTNPGSRTTLGAGHAVDSVTDMILDPFNSNRLIVGLGRIGLAPTAGTTGVWVTVNGGAAWSLVEGGDNPAIPLNGLPNELQAGSVLGRVTVAIGSGRTGNEGYVYVMIGTPPGNNTPPNVNWGSFSGLYRTKDNMLNFTKVMLKEDLGPTPTPNVFHNFVDINLLSRDASNAGAMVVDPQNPNVVYVGGSSRWGANVLSHMLIRVDTGNMADTTTGVTRPGGATFGITNDGDDASKESQSNSTTTPAAPAPGYYDPAPGPKADAYKGEGVYWYDLAENASNTNGNLTSLPSAITSLALDAQGRLLVGTIGGIWRGIGYGFGYDFTSGGTGILGGFGGPGPGFVVPAMTFTSINGNLQIADMTSVAVDPFNRGVYYTTQNDTGVAGSTGPLVWVSQGLTGPTTVTGVNLGIPNAGSVLTSNPAPTFIGLITGTTGSGVSPITVTTANPHGLTTGTKVLVGGVQGNTAANGTFTITVVDATHFSLNGTVGNGTYTSGGNFGTPAPAGTPVSLFRIWQYANQRALQPETSADNGATWSSINSTGISINTPAGFFPAFAIDPTPILQSGLYQTVLAFGANVVYTTDTSATVWDQISAVLSPGADVSAVAFAPSDPTAQTLYAGTTDGHFFFTSNKGGDNWPQRDTGLPVAVAGSYIRGIAVDPNNPNEVFVMFGGSAGTTNHVWRSTNAGLTWTNVSAGLPKVPAYSMVIDRKPGLGAPNGKLYLATEVGVFYSLDDGNTWARLGQGMPNVPVVDLKYDAGLSVLAAATLGRGVYTINTAAFSFIPDQVIDENTPSNVIPVTINNPNGTLYTLTAVSSNQFLVKSGAVVLGGSGQNRTIQFTPVLNANTPKDGTANITVTLTAGSFTYSQTFSVTVNFVNQLATISPIATQTTLKNVPTPAINFSIGDVETPASALVVTASSNNNTLVPNGNIVLGGSGPNRTITITPANNQVGSAVITISVADGNGGISTRSFDLLVSTAVTLPFNDDFNRADSTIFLGPGWTVNSGSIVLKNTQASFNAGVDVASLNQLSVGDVALQGVVTTAAGKNLGLIARYTGTNNFYWGCITNNGATVTADIWKSVNGVLTRLASAPVTAVGGVGTLRFEVASDSLKLFYGALGASPLPLVAFANDRALAAPGRAGLRSSTGGVTLDDFSASAINLQTPGLGFSDTFLQGDGTQLSLNWVNQAGNFADATNTMVANAAAPISMATIYNLNLTGGFAQAEFNVVGVNSQAGVVARYSNTGYYYAVITNTGSSFTANIYRNITNAATGALVSSTRLTTPVTLASGSGTVRLEAVGSSLKMFVGPTGSSPQDLTTYAYDTTFVSGATGIRASAGMAVDAFSTDAITLKAPTLMPFDDDFSAAVNTNQLYGNAGQLSGPNERNWQDVAGDFNVSGGTAIGTSSVVSYATLYDNVAANLTSQAAEANIVVDPAAGQQAGVVVRANAAGAYYAQIRSTGTGFVANIFKINNAGTVLAQLSALNVPVSGGTGLIRFEAAGPSLKLFYNGSFICFAIDSSFASGFTGMRASTGLTTAIADFHAEAIPLTNPFLPFADDFSAPVNGDQLSRDWTERLGHFTVNVGQQLVGNATFNIATVNGVPPLADESVQVEIIAGTASQNTGLIARYQTNGSYYLATIAGNAAQTLFTPFFYKSINGVLTSIALTRIISVPLAGTGTMKLEVTGTSLKLFWNGALAAYGYDSTASLAGPGLMGIRVSKNVVLDNFGAAQITEVTPPTLPFTDDFATPVNGNQLYGNPGLLLDNYQRNWDERSGNILVNGASQAVGNATGFSIATVHAVTAADTAVQADISLGATQAASLIARYQANGSYYLAQVIANATGTASTAYLYIFNGGVFSQIGSAVPIAAVAGTLRFEVIGTDLKLFFGPNSSSLSLITNGYNTTLVAGLMGMRIGKGAAVSNFSADAITLVTPLAFPFNDDFGTPVNSNQLYGDPLLLNGADERNWEERAGSFFINGSKELVANATNSLATVHGLTSVNTVVQADIAALGPNQHADLVARYQTTNGSFLMAMLSSNASSVVTPILYRSVNGVLTQLNVGSLAPVTGAGTLRLEVAGTSLKMFWNNTLVAYGFDMAISAAGLAGVRGSKFANFDNFSVGQIILTTPSLTPSYSDPFTEPAGTTLSSDWTERQGLFSFTGTALQSVVPAGGFSIATVNTPVLDSATQIDINVPAIGTHLVGLVARFNAANGNTYIGKLVTVNGVTTAYVQKRIGGVFYSLNSAPLAAATGAGVLRLEVAGPDVKLFYGPNAGSLVLATYAVDTALSTTGLSGVFLGASDTAANFNLSVIPLTTPGLPFTDNFTGNNGTQLTHDWLERSGNYGVQGNKIVGNATLNVGTVNGLNLSSVNVDLDVIVGVAQSAGAILRYQANGSYYYSLIVSNSPSAGYTAYIYRYNAANNTATKLASAPVATGTGTMSFRAVGPDLQLFYGSTLATESLIAYAYDTTYTSGSTGIRSSKGANLDNFTTTAVNIPTSQPATFTETFAASPPTNQLSLNWTERAGNFSVAGGPATGVANAVTLVNGAPIVALNGISLATVNGINAANADLSANVNVSAANQFASLVARYSGNPGFETYYAASITFVSAGNYKVDILKVVNGVKTVLGTTNVAAFTTGLRFLVVNGNLNVYLDNNALAALTILDTSITAAGLVGVRVNAGAKVVKFTSS